MFYEHYRSSGNRYLMIGQEAELFSFSLHLHKSYELILVTEGKLGVQIGGQEYALSAGEAALIFPGRPHGYSILEQGKCRMAIFSADYLPELKNEYKPILKLSASFLERLHGARDRYFEVKSLLYELAAEYVRGEPSEERFEEDALICALAAYIDAHFCEPLTLKQLADNFGYHYRYMSGLINHHFGESFPRVINQFRINRACELLRKGGRSITEVAAECGFDSQRNFNRVFKELTGKTPKEMKK